MSTAEQQKIEVSEKDADFHQQKYSSELEPTVHALPFYDRESMSAIWWVLHSLCIEIGSIAPTNRKMFEIPDRQKVSPRMTVVFEVDRLLNPEEVEEINKITNATYYLAQETRQIELSSNSAHQPFHYPKMPDRATSKVTEDTGYLGYLTGPDISNQDIDALTEGVFVMRKFPTQKSKAIKADTTFRDFLVYPGPITDSRGNDLRIPPKTKIEIRDGGLSQVDFLELVITLSAILSKVPVPENLYAKIYDRIMSLKLKTSPNELPGTESTQNEIERRLLLPVADPELAKRFGISPQNVLLVGVPGTGKTELAKLTLRKGAKLGVVVLFLDAEKYAEALMKENGGILSYTKRIRQKTGRNVIIVVDDIEEVGGSNEKIRTVMMNHLAGAVGQDYYLLATTNYPEKMTAQVMNPERLCPIYCDLPNEKARAHILKTHMPSPFEDELNGGDLPWFALSGDMERIIDIIAEGTEGLDSRNLRAICTEASARLYQRVTTSQAFPQFTYQDWIDAYRAVMLKHDAAATKVRCRTLLEFVEKGRKRSTQSPLSRPPN